MPLGVDVQRVQDAAPDGGDKGLDQRDVHLHREIDVLIQELALRAVSAGASQHRQNRALLTTR